MPRIGVFICWCGTNIAGTVEIEQVVNAARSFPGVVYAGDYRYLCSEVGQKLIKDTIKKENLERVVVGTCSPHAWLPFRRCGGKFKSPPLEVEQEHCSWF